MVSSLAVNIHRLIVKTEKLVNVSGSKQQRNRILKYLETATKWISESQASFSQQEKEEMLKRIQVISKSVHTKSITPLRLDDGAGLPFDNESEVLVETQQLKEENIGDIPSEMDQFQFIDDKQLKSVFGDQHEDELIPEDEKQISALIEQNMQEQEVLKDELAKLVSEFKEYCGRSSNIISSDVSKISNLEDLLDQNIDKLTDTNKVATQITGENGGSWMGALYAYIRMVIFLLIIGIFFILTFFLILYKNKR